MTISLDKDQKQTLADLESARVAAKKVFKVEAPTPAMVLGCHDRIYQYEGAATQKQVLEELLWAAEHVRSDLVRLNVNVESADAFAEYVFGVYGRVFPDTDEE